MNTGQALRVDFAPKGHYRLSRWSRLIRRFTQHRATRHIPDVLKNGVWFRIEPNVGLIVTPCPAPTRSAHS